MRRLFGLKENISHSSVSPQAKQLSAKLVSKCKMDVGCLAGQMVAGLKSSSDSYQMVYKARSLLSQAEQAMPYLPASELPCLGRLAQAVRMA